MERATAPIRPLPRNRSSATAAETSSLSRVHRVTNQLKPDSGEAPPQAELERPYTPPALAECAGAAGLRVSPSVSLRGLAMRPLWKKLAYGLNGHDSRGPAFLFCFILVTCAPACQSTAALAGAFFFAASRSTLRCGSRQKRARSCVQKQKQKNVFITAQGACPKRASFH